MILLTCPHCLASFALSGDARFTDPGTCECGGPLELRVTPGSERASAAAAARTGPLPCGLAKGSRDGRQFVMHVGNYRIERRRKGGQFEVYPAGTLAAIAGRQALADQQDLPPRHRAAAEPGREASRHDGQAIRGIRMIDGRNVVPCDGCVACCKRERVILYPEHGDDVASYETLPATINDAGRKIYGDGRVMLAHKPNGNCIYLGEHGCTIWDRAPAMCREFDCRRWFARFNRAQRRLLLAKGFADRDVIRAGSERVHTLRLADGIWAASCGFRPVVCG